MIYGYIRVSTDKQTVENQRFEINNWCEKKGMVINGWIEDEAISGTKDYRKRNLGKLLKKAKKEDIIICSELSRLGRNLFMIMEILNYCMEKDIRVHTIKDGYRLHNERKVKRSEQRGMDRTLDKSFAQKRQSFIDVYQKNRNKKAKEVETVGLIEQEKAYLKELKTLLARHKKRKKLRAMEHIENLIKETEERIKTFK